jgi:signal transduction histidine kinase/DNA-binding response OmpR family regulator
LDSGDRPPTDRANILLVDDLPDKLLVLESVLVELGQNIIMARSGEEALRKVLEFDFAVILLDVHLPGMDGLETAGYIRRRKRSAHTPIIFMTADADDMHAARGYRLGAVDYIFAPVVPEVLRTKVKVFVDLHLMTQQVRRQADERVALAQEQAARAAAEDATRRFAFLAEASTALSSTLDYEATLRALTQHLVPALADLGSARPVDEQGRPGRADLAWIGLDGAVHVTTTEDDRPLPGLADALSRCLQTGRMVHLTNAGPWPALPTGAATHAASPNGALAVEVRMRSVAIVPLTARGRTLGVITLAMGPSGRGHSPADLALATDLAARAAIALDNARLYQNIQQEDERKNQFLAMLAHELRNPLAPIRNAVHVLKMVGTTEPVTVEARDMIDRQVAHMARLVDDLLDMSRLARGKIYLRKERIDLTRLVRDTIADYRSLLAQAGLDLQLDLLDAPLYVQGDATRLAQVLGNVLHNASKFTDRGGAVAVRLAVDEATVIQGDKETRRQGDKENGNVALSASHSALLSVRDTGIGMDRAMLERVFDTFSQADSSLDRSRGGLGLGLALVRGLVDLHGGTVSAASAGHGQGTEIVVRLPLADAVQPAEPSRAPAAPATAVHRVLVIEDNVDAAESLRMLFAMTGHAVQVAHAGPAGLEAARTFRPEVVLCDIGLPGGMDGYAVARAIRRDPALSGVRLIALSGYGQEDDRRRSREAGFDMHLIKPVDFGELCRLLNVPEPLAHDSLR